MKATAFLRGIGLLVVFSQVCVAEDPNGGAAAGPEANAIGIWQAVKLVDDTGKSLTGGIYDDFLAERIDVRPDHTYGMTNPASGHGWGAWKLSGNELSLTPSGRSSVLTTLTVEPPHLVDRHTEGITITFDKTGPSPKDTPPKFHVKASDLLIEVKKDFAAAKTKYNEARVEVSGVVNSIDNMATGPSLRITSPVPAGADASDFTLLGGLLCEPADPQPWASVARLQPVKVTGIAILINNDVEIGEARFAPDGPSLLINMTAADLVAEYKKDPQVAKNKYSDKPMILTGTIVQKQINSGKPSMLTLGSGDNVVYCQYDNSGADNDKVLGPLQTGQTIKLAGEYDAYGDQKGPQLQKCNLITP